MPFAERRNAELKLRQLSSLPLRRLKVSGLRHPREQEPSSPISLTKVRRRVRSGAQRVGGVEVGVHLLFPDHLALLRIIDQKQGLDDVLALDHDQDPDHLVHLLLLHILLAQDTHTPLFRVDALEHLLPVELTHHPRTNVRDHVQDHVQDQNRDPGRDHLRRLLVQLELTLHLIHCLSAQDLLWPQSMLLLHL